MRSSTEVACIFLDTLRRVNPAISDEALMPKSAGIYEVARPH
jgi:hypothetical protein